jgi:hypothetical protein
MLDDARDEAEMDPGQGGRDDGKDRPRQRDKKKSNG